MQAILTIAKETVIQAARRAGQIAKSRFDGTYVITEKGLDGDVVTEVDHLAEAEILRCIQKQFPDHQIRSEETGWVGVESDWLWLVDPLDGTNNFAIGLPLYGVAITLLYKSQPILGVVYDSHLDKIYLSEIGFGASCEGKLLQVQHRNQVRKMTIGWIQGHQVQKADEAMRLKHHLDKEFKRVLRLWAPSLLWCMVARGDLDGIVLYDSEGDDLYAGVLMVKEAGGVVLNFDGSLFEGMSANPFIIACHPHNRDLFLDIVREGLKG